MSTSLSSHNYKKNYWAASATSSSSHQSRFFHQSTYAQGQQSTESACSLILSSGASPFAASSAHSFGSIGESESCTAFSMLPLPPVVERMDRAGSPLSPFLPSDPYETAPNSSSQQIRYSLRNSHSNHFNSLSNGSARTHSNIGGSGGGGGDGGATAPADMSPGGGDANDGDQPSEYTFRRRNAIVEGSDDAPKADDFPNNSPK
ncbi:hypothetical protein BGZ83_008043 [Gryganskiella cystojenkinii]|nr:hypothetical protein BGZ83_008043 [Gryganskiella cystojenkinii]